jgi:hypothetical protein
MYGLEVGILPVFEILVHFLFHGIGSPRMVMTYIYHQMSLDTRIQDMYDLGVRISTVPKILGHFLSKN